jgi:hypothetical protein
MSDHFDQPTEPLFSPFWPLAIFLSGFTIWLAYQDFELNVQRGALTKQFQAAGQTLLEAQNITQQYVQLSNDLLQTAKTDQAAAEIIKAAIQAGLFHVQQTPNTNSAGTPAEPSK